MDKTILTFSEACEFTGISKSYMYRLTSSRLIPHWKPRQKMIYFKKIDLENWLLQNRVTTIDESEEKAIEFCKNGGLK